MQKLFKSTIALNPNACDSVDTISYKIKYYFSHIIQFYDLNYNLYIMALNSD